jgi:hypothetical protein
MEEARKSCGMSACPGPSVAKCKRPSRRHRRKPLVSGVLRGWCPPCLHRARLGIFYERQHGQETSYPQKGGGRSHRGLAWRCGRRANGRGRRWNRRHGGGDRGGTQHSDTPQANPHPSGPFQERRQNPSAAEAGTIQKSSEPSQECRQNPSWSQESGDQVIASPPLNHPGLLCPHKIL